MNLSAIDCQLRRAAEADCNVRLALRNRPFEERIEVIADFWNADFDRVHDLELRFDVVPAPVYVIRLSDAEEEPSFLAEAIAEGSLLVDQEGLWPRLRRREASLRCVGRVQDAERKRAALAKVDRFLAERR
jgi:hypothetical protein